MRAAPESPGTVTLGRSTPLVLLVLAVCAVVAVSANGLTLLATPLDPTAPWLAWVRAAGVVAIAIGVTGLLAQRMRWGGRGKDPTSGGVKAAAAIMVALTLAALLNPPPPRVDESARSGGAGLVGLPPLGGARGPSLPATTRGGDSPMRGRPLPDRIDGVTVVASRGEASGGGMLARLGNVLPWLLLLGVVAILHRRFSQRLASPRPGQFSIMLAPNDAAAGLEASLSAVAEFGSDPRGQITLAYHRLLEALARAGAPREPQEAPHEHLHRALGPLGVTPEPLHRLAALYVFAQFGTRPVTDEERRAAAAALRTGLADLRRAVPALGVDPGGTHEGAPA